MSSTNIKLWNRMRDELRSRLDPHNLAILNLIEPAVADFVLNKGMAPQKALDHVVALYQQGKLDPEQYRKDKKTKGALKKEKALKKTKPATTREAAMSRTTIRREGNSIRQHPEGANLRTGDGQIRTSNGKLF